MAEQNPPNVLVAYEMLLEELEAEIDRTDRTGGKHLSAGDHARAQKALDRAQGLLALRTELLVLGDRIRALSTESPPRPARPRLRKGLKTPQPAYRLPILRTLVEMGGSGSIGHVLDRVYEIMKARLNEHDLAAMPSDPATPRWRNTGQWARNALREEGLIGADSPRGIWEITEQGRQWLSSQSSRER